MSDDPRIKTIQPLAMAASLLDEERRFEKVDFVFTFSTLEHIGLGRYAFQLRRNGDVSDDDQNKFRYGDPLDPDGDVKLVEQIRGCLLKPGGLLYVGLPIGRDCIVWNVHRLYAMKRLRYLLPDWRFVGVFGNFQLNAPNCEAWHAQPTIVLQNTFGCG